MNNTVYYDSTLVASVAITGSILVLFVVLVVVLLFSLKPQSASEIVPSPV